MAFRLVRGWSQRRAADAWNERWPDELKTLKNFSYWELWPGSTGHEPSLATLGKLAQLYECSVSDLLVDCPDYRHLDTAASPEGAALRRGDATVAIPGDATTLTTLAGLQLPDHIAILLANRLGLPATATDSRLVTPRDRDHTFDQLVQVLTSWAHTMDRRHLLRLLGWAATAAAAAPTFPNPDEHERVAAVLTNPNRIDAQTIQHVEDVLWRCKRQDDALGPHVALDTVLVQRNLARTLLRECPQALRPRLLSVLSSASRQA